MGKCRYTVGWETPARSAISRVVMSSARRSASSSTRASRMRLRVRRACSSRSGDRYLRAGSSVMVGVPQVRTGWVGWVGWVERVGSTVAQVSNR